MKVTLILILIDIGEFDDFDDFDDFGRFHELTSKRVDPFEEDWSDDNTVVLVNAFINVDRHGLARHTIIKAIGERFGARKDATVASVIAGLNLMQDNYNVNEIRSVVTCKQLLVASTPCVCVCVRVCVCVCVCVCLFLLYA